MLRSIHVHLLLGALGMLLIAACDGVAIGPDDDTGFTPDGTSAIRSDASTSVPGTDAGDPGRTDGATLVDGCAPRCDGRVCGDDQCGGICGACGENHACNASGQCDAVSEECPPSGAPLNRSYPAVWSEGQCIVRWECSNCGAENGATMRAHYHQPGNLLYAKKHRIDGEESFVSGGFLTNLGVERRQSIAFCEAEPSGSSCERLQIPDCGPYQARASCSTLFHWSHDNRAVRLRRTGAKLWAESQDPSDGSWNFTQASWMDASGDLPAPDVGYFCFEETKPAGNAEPCP